MKDPTLNIPPELENLLALAIWPQNADQSQSQNTALRISAPALQRLIPEENQLYLLQPPFQSASAHGEPNDWCAEPDGQPELLDTRLLLVIAEFEIGADAFIALDYRTSPERPAVLYFRNHYRWPGFLKGLFNPALRGKAVRHGTYRQIAPDFRRFAETIGLL